MTPGRLANTERRKRRREVFAVILISILFFALSWGEFKLASMSKSLPFVHSIFFFGLVNFNIILLLFLVVLTFRNVVKVFVESDGNFFGSLKAKLITAFVSFSLIPTVLLFLISVFYINSSFDKWFSAKMGGVLKDSLEVTNTYYVQEKQSNFHFARNIKQDFEKIFSSSKNKKSVSELLSEYRSLYNLDSIEYYSNPLDPPFLSISKEKNIIEIPKLSVQLLKEVIEEETERSTIHHYQAGNLIRVVVPVKGQKGFEKGAIVVSSFVPISIVTRMDDIASTYEDFRNVNPLEYPIKSIYLIILVMMTLAILFAAVWFGIHLARSLSNPVEKVAEATRAVAKGSYSMVESLGGFKEINELVVAFNRMTKDLKESEIRVLNANNSLKETLARLDERSRYIEVVLANVTTAVMSLDSDFQITTINRHAREFLAIKGIDPVGKHYKDVISSEKLIIVEKLLNELTQYELQSLSKEIRTNINGEPRVIQGSASTLHDQGDDKDIGYIFVLEDLTMLMQAQKSAAWKEVARRIAHEIKNPLTPIKLSAQRLEKKFGEEVSDPSFERCIKTIIDQVDDLKNLVNEFSNFARLPQAKLVQGDLNQVIRRTIDLYETGHKEIKFIFKEDNNLPAFDFDRDQMSRVMVNLIENAIMALRGIEDPKIQIATNLDSVLGIVKVRFSDNGNGMNEDVRRQCFEPYFSTKNEGTGLGLAIVKRIIDDHNGFIRAFRNRPKGTQFLIELPLNQAKLERTVIQPHSFGV